MSVEEPRGDRQRETGLVSGFTELALFVLCSEVSRQHRGDKRKLKARYSDGDGTKRRCCDWLLQDVSRSRKCTSAEAS